MNTQRDLTLRFLAESREVNFAGKVHGGTAMKWIVQPTSTVYDVIGV